MNDWFEWNGRRCTELGIHVLEQPVYVQQEMARRRALGAQANKSLNLTCFSGKIKCPYCHVSYMHDLHRRKSSIDYWICGSRKKKKVGDGCPVKGTLSEVALKKCCAEALGLEVFEEAISMTVFPVF